MNDNVKNRHLRHLKRLAKLAEDVAPVGSARLAASIVLRNTEISYGTCLYKTDPFQAKYGSNASCIFIHAEIAAIKNALKRLSLEDLKRSTLYIARVKKPLANSDSFIWGHAKPCAGCSSAISAFEINKVVFTCDGDGNFKEF